MKTAFLVLGLLILLFIIPACDGSWISDRQDNKKRLIGLSQCMLDDAWRQAMIREAEIEASIYDDIELVIRNADTNNKQQIDHIRELIALPVDVLIISPNESEPLTAVAEEAFRAGIPTIITDRKINSELYTTFVGANNYQIGYDAGKYAGDRLTPHAVILEIWGLSTSSPAQERHEGFVDALTGRSDLSFIKLDGEWRYDSTAVRLRRAELPVKIDFVYAHNDVMAIAAREYFAEKDPDRGADIHIIGVDGVAGAGLEAVADGRLDASFLYPTGGKEVVRAARQIINGEHIPRYIPLQSAEVNRSVARTSLLQSERIASYQEQIERQRSRLDSLSGEYLFLRSSLGIIFLLMIVFVGLTIYIFYINRKVKITNRALRETNKKEQEQRHKLIALNAEIEEVTARKLQFFTNISHEVRTPLTLILGPLDRLLLMMSDSPYIRDLELVHKNAERLHRVINQMLDFRKMENNREELRIRQTDIVSFTREVMCYFDNMAHVRHIDYSFVSDCMQCMILMDTDRMEKVLVNLLSNAFKFTDENGKITVSLKEKADSVVISVEDNGRGIHAENLSYVFDRFFMEDHSAGTGIGLHLVKQYVMMHHGEVDVKSEPNVSTVFTISLRKGKDHFPESGIAEQAEVPFPYQASGLNNSETEDFQLIRYPYTLLIVEDDEDLRGFLARELEPHFTVLTAADGQEALDMLEKEKEVSLVLSDVMMPVINGFELCRSIKSNLSYSHIPVMLLTALTDERQRFYGVSRGADAYVQKPFDSRYVKLKIIRLLEDRKRYREHLLRKLQDDRSLLNEPDQAENIDDRFLRRFMARLEEVYRDPAFNVEKLSTTLGLSRGHLHRKIKELTGISPVEFLRNYRLRKASELITQNKLTISEIAYQTGFSSPAYFTKCFKDVYGVTPGEARGKEL